MKRKISILTIVLLLLVCTQTKTIAYNRYNSTAEITSTSDTVTTTTQKNNVSSIKQTENQKTDQIGTLSIPNIALEQPLYQKESKQNSIDKNVTFLKESTYPNEGKDRVILCAHSGTGKIAFFQELDHLQKNDSIYLTYQDETLTYIVDSIKVTSKDGTISIPQQKHILVLTTCMPHQPGYQLTIIANKKEII